MAERSFVDLLDPDEESLVAATQRPLEPVDVWQAVRPSDRARPRILARDDYVFAVLVIPVAVPDEDRVYEQEVDLILLPDELALVRKTPADGEPFETDDLHEACHPTDAPGAKAATVLDYVAESYLAFVDAVDAEIDELEDRLETLRPRDVGRRIADLRHDILRLRRTLTPTREAVRRLVDGRLEEAVGRDVVPHEAEIRLADVYDKLLRAGESLDLARDVLTGARDYHQALIANQQNDVTKRLAVIASLLLVPTFIVGVYGQNFDHMPELHWRLGYLFSWVVIAVATVAQLVFFRSKRWL